MPSDDDHRARARQRVSDEMVKRSLGPVELARVAGVDPATVGDFLNGRRWPQPGNRHKIAVALGWAPEGIDLLVRGEEPSGAGDHETVSAPTQDDDVLLSMPPGALDGLTPAEREEVVTAAKLSALTRAREIRRRLDE